MNSLWINFINNILNVLSQALNVLASLHYCHQDHLGLKDLNINYFLHQDSLY